MPDSAPSADPCQESIHPPWQLCHFLLPRLVPTRGVFSRLETQWPAKTKTSTTPFKKLATEFSYRFWQVLQYPPISSRDTTIRKRQSLSTCRLSFSNISLTNSEILPQRKHAM
jgi:hypothetical protein